jgi:hypothetical protein
MASRATAFAKRPTTGRAAERARSRSEPLGEPVPLPIAELLEPYDLHRGLSIRIERLAHGARLSKGRNNGDRSYSLAPDDVDDLEYVPASASYDAHTLAVRIISVEGGDAETLAVIDLPIAASTAANDTLPSAPPAPVAVETAPSADTRALREELANAKLSLAAREMELAGTRKLAEEAERSRKALAEEFAAAEATWDSELRRRLSEADAAFEKSRVAWQAEQSARALKSESGAQHTANRAIEEARKRWEAEAQAAIAKAQSDWKAAEAVRLAAAEAHWRDQSGLALADWRAKAERAEAALVEARKEATARANVAASSSDAELRQLREQLSTAKTNLSATQANLAARTAELAETRAAAEIARNRAQQGATDLAKAEQGWKAAEAARFAAAEARWKEQSARVVGDSSARMDQLESALAEARAQAETRQLQLNVTQASLAARDQEVAELRAASSGEMEQIESALVEARAQAEMRSHQLNATEASLVARENELAQLRAALEEARTRSGVEADIARARWQHEMESALAQAQDAWKAGEAARLATAEVQWKAQFAPAGDSTAELQRAEAELAQVRADAQAQIARGDEEVRRLRDELATAQTTLTARQHELAETKAAVEEARATAHPRLNDLTAEIEKARHNWQEEADAALAKAKQAWRAEEAPRLAAAEARLQETVALRLTQAEERFQRAESALADSRACSEALRHELAAAQASLANREIELAESRATLEQERERWSQAPAAAQPVRKPAWEEDEEERRTLFRRRLIRDVAVVACLGALAFMLFSRVQPVVADAWPQNFSLKSDFQPLLQMAGLAAPPPPPAAEPEPHALVDVRVANLRENPSTGAAVVTKLARNVEVTPVEHRGEWVFVRVGEGTAQRQGWIANSVLKEAGDKAAAHE